MADSNQKHHLLGNLFLPLYIIYLLHVSEWISQVHFGAKKKLCNHLLIYWYNDEVIIIHQNYDVHSK